MTVQLIRKVRDRQPSSFPRVKSEYIKDLDFLWIPGFPELVTKQQAVLVGNGKITSGKIGRVLKSAIAGYAGQGAYFLNQRICSANVTIIVVCSNFSGTDNLSSAPIFGNNNNARFAVDNSGQLRFVSSTWHDSGVYIGAEKNTLGVVFGESFGSAFYTNGQFRSYVSGSGLYSWSAYPYKQVAGGDSGYSVGLEVGLVVAWRVRLPSALVAELTRNPWQIFEPETIPLFYSTVTAQYARPTSDVSAGTWTASTGSDLFAMLDETTASDTDYIITTGASTCEVALGTLSDPASSSGHIVRYRISADSGGITVRLRQGTTTIATWTHASAPTSLTTYAQTLTGGEADSITDYSALKLQFEAT